MRTLVACSVALAITAIGCVDRQKDDAPATAPKPDAATLASANTDLAQGSVGGWQVHSSKDPLLDTPLTVASLSSEDTVGLASASFIVRCQKNKTEAYIVWQAYLGLETIEVTRRLDSAPARTDVWSLSTDGKATLYPSDVRRFLRSLEAVRSLLVRVTPYREAPIRARFLLSGIRAIQDSIGGACGWKHTDSVTVARAIQKKRLWEERIASAKWVEDQSAHVLYRDWPSCKALITVEEVQRVVFRSKEQALAEGYTMNGYSGCGESPPKYVE